MVRSMFAGVAGLRAHQSKLDVIGNNIANVNTWGYKAGSANFMDSLYTNNTNSTGGAGQVVGGQGGTNASQVGYGVQISSISRDFSKSTPYQTGRDLDIMIEGTGFLIVGTSPGAAALNATGDLKNLGVGVKLSRVGILSIDNEGYLVDNNRNYIYGYGTDDNGATFNTDFNGGDTLQRIRIPMPDANRQLDATDENGNPIKITLNEEEIGTSGLALLKNYRIMSDGTVVGFTSRSEQKLVLGKIALADVQNVDGLQSDSGYYYDMGDNTGDCMAAESNGILGSFLTGYLEMPNVDLAKEFSEMITTQRGYQANTKVITVTDEMLQELVNMKR